MEENQSEAIPVNSIAEEYRIVSRARCACGGTLHVERQALLFREEHPYDLLEAVCQRCGQLQRFLFNIESFFGKLPV
ncbi:MAG: hypothetical protein ACP5SI_08390 [Chloroflexia bacterium]